MKPKPIKFHGGKSYLADWIISYMPSHTHYVEPFFGGGAVLFRKDPEGVSEVVNDLDGMLMDFWTVIQNPILFDQFRRAVCLLPFSELTFNACCDLDCAAESKLAGITLPSVSPWIASAVRVFVQYRQSRQGLGKSFATLSKTRTRRGMNEQVSQWLSAIEGLPEFHQRLQRVVLMSRSFESIIRSEDSERTLFYCDPPYVHSTRSTTDDYGHEMQDSDHEQLLDVLAGIKGKFILSGYRNALYDKYAALNQWRREDRKIDNKASSKPIKQLKVESIWMNYSGVAADEVAH